MVFPLYNAIESLDKNQIEAARDLGAPWWRIHKEVVMPYAKPGIASGCTMVFMLSAGALAAPAVPRRAEHFVVHLDCLRFLLPGVQLAARRRLRLHPARRLHRLRSVDAASLQGQPRGDDKMRSSLVIKAMIGFYILLFFAYLFGPLVVMSVTAFNTPNYPTRLSVRGLHARLVRQAVERPGDDGRPVELGRHRHRGRVLFRCRSASPPRS